LISTRLDFVLAEHGAFPIYLIIFATGLARGFMTPAQTAFAAQLVPRELFGNASTWSSLAWQTAEVTGPAAGGLVYGFAGVGTAYTIVTIMSAAGFISFCMITNKPVPEHKSNESIWQSLKEGVKFVSIIRYFKRLNTGYCLQLFSAVPLRYFLYLQIKY